MNFQSFQEENHFIYPTSVPSQAVPQREFTTSPPALRRPSPTINTNLVQDPRNQPRSAVNRHPSPLRIKTTGRRRFNSFSCLPTIPSAGLQADPMSWQQGWQGVSFAPPPNNDETALGLEGTLNGFPGFTYAPQSNGFHSGDHQNLQYNYRPALALETSGPSFSQPQYQMPSAYSSNPPSGLGTDLSSIDGEQVITPDMFSFNTYPGNGYEYAQNGQPQHYQNEQAYYQTPFYNPPQGTISPSQISHQQLKPIKTFKDLISGSRESSSSSSSTEGGLDWNNSLDDWTKPLHRALPDSHIPTVPEPAQKTINVPSHSQLPTSATGSVIRNYISSPNRLSFGERKVMVMSPKVGQKSYGNEKRFLCPHPQAALVGESWWSQAKQDCPMEPKLPPRVNISLSGETVVKDAPVNWTTVDGINLGDKLTEPLYDDKRPFLGTIAGKNLHISDADSKRRDVKALVTVKAPLLQHAGDDGWGPAKGTLKDITNEVVLGTFESREIKIISKPSKKKSSSKSSELAIQHGTTIALFNRVRSQTTSTRYLGVSTDLTKIVGSDGQPMTGTQPPRPVNGGLFGGFTADSNVWESFIIWLVDPTARGGQGVIRSTNSDWPNPPINVIPLSTIVPLIRYNTAVVLQSIQTGIISPTLIVRRIDEGSEAVGMDGLSNDIPIGCPFLEYPGDPVSQLHKVGFELYNPDTMTRLSQDARYGGYWLSCDNESVMEHFVRNERRWSTVTLSSRGSSRPNSVPSTPSQRFGILPMTPHNGPSGLPSTPSSPVSSSSSDYFGAHSRKSSSSLLISPAGEVPLPLPSTDGGPVRRQRTGSTSRNPLNRPLHKKRASTDAIMSGHLDHATGVPVSNGSDARSSWTMDIGDICVWSIVSTEQVNYTFYAPPLVPGDVKEPFAPFPSVQRILPPGTSADAGLAKYAHQYTSMVNIPLVTLYGKGFQKNASGAPQHQVYYGENPSVYNEVRCAEVMAAAEPHFQPTPHDSQQLLQQQQTQASPPIQQSEIFLVKDDGQCIIPTSLVYP